MASGRSRSGASARLYTGIGGWGIPTVDPEGLSVHALLKFGGIPYSTVASLPSPLEPPVVVIEKSGTTGASPDSAIGIPGLVSLFSADSSLPDPNPGLTPFMVSESTAFATLLSARFAPARMYEFFINQANYGDLYHKILSRGVSFPMNLINASLKRREVRAAQSASKKSERELYFDASIALAALATRLGDRNKYFYGDRPSVLDAVVFGQLAVVLFVPLPDARLRPLVASHPNLVQFVSRIKKEYFSDGDGWYGDLDPEEIAAIRKTEAERRAAEQSRAQEEAEDAQRARREAEGRSPDGSKLEEDEDTVRKRHNAYFIYGSVAVFLAHILLGSEVELEVG